MIDFTSTQAVVSIILSATTVGLFGALKYYSNTLGNNPESFDIMKFAPIAVLGIIISIGSAIFGDLQMTQEGISQFIAANFILVVFANTAWTIIQKKFLSTTVDALK